MLPEDILLRTLLRVLMSLAVMGSAYSLVSMRSDLSREMTSREAVARLVAVEVCARVEMKLLDLWFSLSSLFRRYRAAPISFFYRSTRRSFLRIRFSS